MEASSLAGPGMDTGLIILCSAELGSGASHLRAGQSGDAVTLVTLVQDLWPTWSAAGPVGPVERLHWRCLGRSTSLNSTRCWRAELFKKTGVILSCRPTCPSCPRAQAVAAAAWFFRESVSPIPFDRRCRVCEYAREESGRVRMRNLCRDSHRHVTASSRRQHRFPCDVSTDVPTSCLTLVLARSPPADAELPCASGRGSMVGYRFAPK